MARLWQRIQVHLHAQVLAGRHERSACAKVSRCVPTLLFALTLLLASPADAAGDWRRYGFDLGNSNFNRFERELGSGNVHHLRRAWETFNDDATVEDGPPTGFLLEDVLGLRFPAPVVGVVASPIVREGVIYYVDALGTVFARDAATGRVLDPARHWSTTLSDPDFENEPSPVLPELIYTAPVVTRDHVWVAGSVYGRLHLLRRHSGEEVDFDPSTPEIDPFTLVEDMQFSSVLGDMMVVRARDGRRLLVAGINVIVNDAVVQGEEVGLQLAFDVSEPTHPVEIWRTFSVDENPATGARFSSGVSIGAGLAVDRKRNLILGGTGQNTREPYAGYPDPALAPPGYVDRSDSMYAMDLTSGEFVWINQFHTGDVFNLNDPVSTAPDQPDGPRDADVLSPPVLFKVRVDGHWRALAGNGSKGGRFRVVDRLSGETLWEREISKATGIGGIQAGAAVARGVIYVAGFEGLDDGFSDAQFGTSLDTGLFPDAFFATFAAAFWADVEDVADDGDPATGMRIKVYALDAATGESLWHAADGRDYVELAAGAALRHVTVANDLVFVTSSSGALFVLDARDGRVLFSDQSPDLDLALALGLGKPHHASMNAGTVVSDARVFVGYGAQNNPSGGILAYELNHAPRARGDHARVAQGGTTRLDVLRNDHDDNGDELQIVAVAGHEVVVDDGQVDLITHEAGRIEVINPGDPGALSGRGFLRFTPKAVLEESLQISYTIQDRAPFSIRNGVVTGQRNPTHTPRRDTARIWLRRRSGRRF